MTKPSPRDLERRLDDLDGGDDAEGPDRIVINSYLVDQNAEVVEQFHRLTVERDGRGGWDSEKRTDFE